MDRGRIAHILHGYLRLTIHACALLSFKMQISQYRTKIRDTEVVERRDVTRRVPIMREMLASRGDSSFLTAVKHGLIGINVFIVIWIIGIQLAARYLGG
jgi:hypothetical protein